MRTSLIFIGLSAFLAVQPLNGQPLYAQSELLLGATDFDGFPAEGAKFRVTREGHDVEELATDVMGQLTLTLESMDEIVVVELDDERFQTIEPMRVSSEEPRVLAYRLFHRNVADMTQEERVAFAEAYPKMISDAEPESAAVGKPEPNAWRLTAFLEGYRRESDTPITNSESETSEENETAIAVRLTDRRGTPLANTVVRLYQFDENAGAIQFSGSERTNERGSALFDQLQADRYYRAETELPSGEIARSAIVISVPDKIVSPPTMTVRSADEMISGIVFDKGVPAPSTVVTVSAQDGLQPQLSTTTDELGYFSLGPMIPGDVLLEFRRVSSDGHSQTTLKASTTAQREIYVPLDVLGNLSAKATTY